MTKLIGIVLGLALISCSQESSKKAPPNQVLTVISDELQARLESVNHCEADADCSESIDPRNGGGCTFLHHKAEDVSGLISELWEFEKMNSSGVVACCLPFPERYLACEENRCTVKMAIAVEYKISKAHVP